MIDYLIGALLALSFSHVARLVMNMIVVVAGIESDTQTAARVGVVTHIIALCLYTTGFVTVVVVS